MYWPEVERGTERLLHDLGSGLAARGIGATVITSHPGRSSTSIEDGIEVIRNRRLPDGFLRRGGNKYWLGHLPGSYLSLRRGDYDLAHAVYPSDALATVGWSRATGRPAVFSVNGIPSIPPQQIRGLRLAGWRVIRDGSATVVTVSEAVASSVRELGADPRVIYPGVDLGAFEPTADRVAEPTIFCPAAIRERRKQVGLLIEAFERLRDRDRVRRLVLSDHAAGPARLPDGVELRNFGRHEELVRTYSEAWLTVLPARREAFGLVLVESLACGTPVVGLNEGGVAEIVDRPTIGGLFADNDPDALGAAIEAALPLAHEPGIRQSCRARAADFSVERSVSAHVDLYRELLGRP